jgi:hypothetical protein
MKPRLFLLCEMALLSLLVAVGTPPAPAADFHVNTSEGLQEALQTATTNGQDDTIYLAAGTYAPHPWSDFHYASDEGRSLTIRGEPGTSPEDVVLDGGHDRQILYMDDNSHPGWPPPDPMPEFSLIGLTFTNSADGWDNAVYVHASMTNVTVQNCRFYNNISNGEGGAIVINCIIGSVNFENNRLENNQLNEKEVMMGGGDPPVYHRETLCMGGGAYIHTAGEVITLRNNVIVNNTARGDFGIGGGLYLSISCPSFVALNLINNTIADNTAGFMAGGVFIKHWAGGAPANLYNNIIYGNEAPDSPVTADIWADVIGISEIYAVSNDMSLNAEVTGLFNPPGGSFDNLDEDPEFLAGTYYPDVASPVIDVGNSLPPPPGLPDTDFLGNPRVCGRAPDLGAFELCGGGWPRAPRPMISLGSKRLVMPAKRKSLLPLMIALREPLPVNPQQVDPNSWPVSFDEDTADNQREWWIFLKKAGGGGIPADSWYLGGEGWTTQPQPFGVAPASKYLDEETQVGTLCPADLGLKHGLYELWFGVDQEVDGKTSLSTLTAQGMYLRVDDNPRYLHPIPRRPLWAGYPAMLNRGAKLNK